MSSFRISLHELRRDAGMEERGMGLFILLFFLPVKKGGLLKPVVPFQILLEGYVRRDRSKHLFDVEF